MHDYKHCFPIVSYCSSSSDSAASGEDSTWLYTHPLDSLQTLYFLHWFSCCHFTLNSQDLDSLLCFSPSVTHRTKSMRLWTAGKPNPASTYLLAYFNASVYNLRSTRNPHYLKISSIIHSKNKIKSPLFT